MTEQNGLERSSATEELRRLLDERGVEWTEPNNEARSHTTYWTAGFLRCAAVEFNDGMVSIASSSDDITPEQAIEATFGRGECEAEVEVVEFSQTQEIHRFTCSECGESFGAEEHGGLFGIVLHKVKLPNYCPNCGRRVVDV